MSSKRKDKRKPRCEPNKSQYEKFKVSLSNRIVDTFSYLEKKNISSY